MSDLAEQHQHFVRSLNGYHSVVDVVHGKDREAFERGIQNAEKYEDAIHISSLRDQARRQEISSPSTCQQCQLQINALTTQADLANERHDYDYEGAALELLVTMQEQSDQPNHHCKTATSWEKFCKDHVNRSRLHAAHHRSGRHTDAKAAHAKVFQLWSDLAREHGEQLVLHTLASEILPSLWQTSDTVNADDRPLTLGTQLMTKEYSSLLWDWTSSQSLDFRQRLLGTWLRRTPEHKAIEHLAPFRKQAALACSRYIQENDDPESWTQMAARFLADAESSHAKNDYYGSFLSDQSAMAILLRLHRLHPDKHKAVVALTWEKQVYRSIDMRTSMTRSKITDPNCTPALALLGERANFWDHVHGDFLGTSSLAQLLMKSTEQLVDKKNNKGWSYWVVAACKRHPDYMRQSKQKAESAHAVQVTKDAAELFKSLYEEDATKWREDYAGALFLYTKCLLRSDQEGDSARAVQVSKDAIELYKTLSEEDATQW